MTEFRHETVEELLTTASTPPMHRNLVACTHVIDGAPVDLYLVATETTRAKLMCVECADDPKGLWQRSAKVVCSCRKEDFARATAASLIKAATDQQLHDKVDYLNVSPKVTNADEMIDCVLEELYSRWSKTNP